MAHVEVASELLAFSALLLDRVEELLDLADANDDADGGTGDEGRALALDALETLLRELP